MSQHKMQETTKDVKFSIISTTEENVSKTQGNCHEKTCSETNGEPLASTSSANSVCSELNTDGCEIKTEAKNNFILEDDKNDKNNDHASPCATNVLLPDKININSSYGSQGNNLNNNVKSPEASDLQRETDSKSPEILVAEVQQEVTKLNISGEEPKTKQQSSGTISKVVVNKETESLKNLMAYDSDSEQSDSEREDNNSGIIQPEENKPNSEINWRKTQDNASGSSDSESDSSASTLSSESESDSDNSDGESINSDDDSASVIDASDDGIRTESPILNKNSDMGAVKKSTQTILDFPEYLPPIPDLSKLNINAEEEFMHIGRVTAVIAELVTVEAIPGIPAFDLDSMLFIDGQTSKKPIGPIFDVIGPVTEPIYCVRFNSEDEIKEMEIKSGIKVYAAPKSEEFTKFVFVKELMKMKGTDASWLNDQEQPVGMEEFSDDEEERQIRRGGKLSIKRKLEDGSLERHKRYEKTMNQCNTLNTRVCKLMDVHKNLSKQIRPSPRDDLPVVLTPPGCPELPSVPPEFNPTVPPPGFGHPSPYSFPSQAMLLAPSPSTFGQPPTFGAMSPYDSHGAQAVFSGPAQFGSFYANQPPSPQSLGPPPARWQQCDNFRRGRHNPRFAHRQNSDNYFTNNSRNLRTNFRGAGPSSQPF